MDAADEVQALKQAILPGDQQLTGSHYAAIARADREHWEPLLRVAAEQSWSASLTSLAVGNLADERLSAEHKRGLLTGEVVPVEVEPAGDFSIPSEILRRALDEWRDHDPRVALDLALEKLTQLQARLRRGNMGDLVSMVGREQLERWQHEIPGQIAYLTELLRAVHRELQGGRRPPGQA